MLDWMIGSFTLFGLPCQNWMLVFGAVFALYLAVAIVLQGRHKNVL
jgi:hypothetical protein